MTHADAPVLTLLARLGEECGGCVTAARLDDAGISARRAESLRDRGALTLVVPGIDLVGPPPITPIALAHAAVLRGGRLARLGGRSGLEWRGLLIARPSLVTVATPRVHLARRERLAVRTPLTDGTSAVIELRPTRRLGPHDIVAGLAVSPVIEGLLALAAAGEWRDLRRAWREADFRRLLTESSISSALGRGVRGSAAIRELMVRDPILGAEYDLLSRAERHLLAGMRRRGLAPLVNAPIRVEATTLRPDFYFQDERLAVEVNGGGHDSPARQREDAARAARLGSIGIETVAYADTEVWRDVDACLDDISGRLADRRAMTPSSPAGSGMEICP